MQLYLIRHAQSENNARWAATGSEAERVPDPEITEIGHQQGELLGEFIAKSDPGAVTIPGDPHNRQGFNLTHLYCSLMTRAIQTASYIADTTGLALHGLDNIHEWGGMYQHDFEKEIKVAVPGPNRAYFIEKFPHLALPEHIGENGWYHERPYEEPVETAVRARQAYKQLLEKHGDSEDRVAIVTHGGFMHVLISLMVRSVDPLNDESDQRRKFFTHHNGAITRFNIGKDYNQVVYLNNVCYLPPQLIT